MGLRRVLAGKLESWDVDQGIKQVSSREAHSDQINDIDGCGARQVNLSGTRQLLLSAGFPSPYSSATPGASLCWALASPVLFDNVVQVPCWPSSEGIPSSQFITAEDVVSGN